MPNDPFVDVTALRSLGSLRYLDARDQAAFDAGHTPGAVRVPLDEWDAAAKAADTGFAKTAYWDDALSALGLDPTVTAVAYDSGGMTNAARVWFILQYYGLNAVILNGGWPVLASATGLPPGAAASPGGFRAVPGSGPVGPGRPGDIAGSARRSCECLRYADARGVHRRGRAQSCPQRPSAGGAAPVTRGPDGEWRGSAGADAARDAGAGRVWSGRPYCDPLRRRREGRIRCRCGGARRV
jgi:rhodanese-related sulfurtransferase